MFNLGHILYILKLCPLLVVSLLGSIKSVTSWSYFFAHYLVHFNHVTSDRPIGRPINSSLFGQERCDNPGICLVAILWTFSRASICGCGLHIWLAYSKCGRTRPVYNILKLLVSIYSIVLLINPINELALFIFSCICASKLISDQ